MNSNLDIDLEDLQDSSPESIANFLFSQDPQKPYTCQLITGQDTTDISYIFEILLTILLEGLDMVSNGLDQFDTSNLTPELITQLDPWFNSLGIKLKISEILWKDIGNTSYYCRIITKFTAPEWFDLKHIQKNYSFNLNGDDLVKNKAKINLKELLGAFRVKDKAFIISFDYLQTT